MNAWSPLYSADLPRATESTPTGDQAGTILCYNCGHSLWAHYEHRDTGGCTATSAPLHTTDTVISGDAFKPFVGSASCLCPGWIRGLIPYALTKHLSTLTDDENAPCTDCEHPLHLHSEEQGCHRCPCTIHETEQP